ncbi:MFS transporter [Streptomyces bauhiniae]|uniref:MFS transporter n=1 Tax=Streptomyces bauhiniae TaxID=2340725 RepID=UPI0035D74C52
MSRILAERRLCLLLFGQLLSTFAGNALWLAVGISVKSLTGNVSAVGTVLLAYLLGALCAPLAAPLVDRFPRTAVVVVTNLLTAGVVSLLAPVHTLHDVWLVHPVMAGFGLAKGIVESAQTALVQTVAPAELFGAAGSASAVIQQGVKLLAPLLGVGLLTTAGLGAVVAVTVAAFLAESVLICALRINESAAPRDARGLFAGAGAGLRHVLHIPVLRRAAFSAALAMAAFGFSQTIMFAVAARTIDRPDSFVGVLVSGQGVGAVAAGLLAPKVMKAAGAQRLAALGMAAAALGYTLELPPATASVLMGVALLGAGSSWLGIGVITLVLHLTPSEVIGRTEAAVGLMLSATQALAVATAAGAIDTVDHRILILLCVGLLGLAAARLRAPAVPALALHTERARRKGPCPDEHRTRRRHGRVHEFADLLHTGRLGRRHRNLHQQAVAARTEGLHPAAIHRAPRPGRT